MKSAHATLSNLHREFAALWLNTARGSLRRHRVQEARAAITKARRHIQLYRFFEAAA
jgi:hypothetical protein